MNKKYSERIDRVIQYIEDNLFNKLSLADVASVSHFSAYHFHRIFTGVVGETVNDYIARRRLECAVNKLIFKPDLSITKVAHGCGYSSSANFSKAVKLHFGFSPSEIRNPDKAKNSKIGKIFSKYGKEFKPSDLYPNRITNSVISESYLEDTNMNVDVRKMDSLRVGTLSSEGGYAIEAIYQTWDKLIDWANVHGIKPDEQRRFSFAYDNPTVTPIDKCRYSAAIVIGNDVEVKPPFSVSEIPKGKYAVLYFKGNPEDAIKYQLGIYSDWLPNSGFEPDDYPMMENYKNDARVDGYIEMEIYVKLKAI